MGGEKVPIAELYRLVDCELGGAKKHQLFIIDACRTDEDRRQEAQTKQGKDLTIGTDVQHAVKNRVTIYGGGDGSAVYESREYGGWLSQSVIWAFLRNAREPTPLAYNVLRMEYALYCISGQKEQVYYVGDQYMEVYKFRTSTGGLLSKTEEADMRNELVPRWNKEQDNDDGVDIMDNTSNLLDVLWFQYPIDGTKYQTTSTCVRPIASYAQAWPNSGKDSIDFYTQPGNGDLKVVVSFSGTDLSNVKQLGNGQI